MGKQTHYKQHNSQKKLKKQSAVTFDAEERKQYLQGMIGAKKRRRQFYLKKVEKEQKETKHQQRAQLKAHRRQELKKAKDLLQKLTQKVEDNYKNTHENKGKDKVEVNSANNLIVETKFY